MHYTDIKISRYQAFCCSAADSTVSGALDRISAGSPVDLEVALGLSALCLLGVCTGQ